MFLKGLPCRSLEDTRTASVEAEMGQPREAFTCFEDNNIGFIFLKINLATTMIYFNGNESSVRMIQLAISFPRIMEND